MDYKIRTNLDKTISVKREIERRGIAIEKVNWFKGIIKGWGNIPDIENLANIKGVISVIWSNYI